MNASKKKSDVYIIKTLILYKSISHVYLIKLFAFVHIHM